MRDAIFNIARLAQLVERKTLNLVVVGSSPTVGSFAFLYQKLTQMIKLFGPTNI